MATKSTDEPSSQYMKKRQLFNISLFTLLALLAVVAFYYREQSLAQIKSTLQGLDMTTAALILVGSLTMAALVMFPVSLLMLFSGAYFGVWWGFLFNTAGLATSPPC